MVIGFCIGGPFIGTSCGGLIVLSPPCWRSLADLEGMPTLFCDNRGRLGSGLIKRRPDHDGDGRSFSPDAHQPTSSSRDTRLRAQCRTNAILPDDVPRIRTVAMEAAMLAPNAEVSMFRGRAQERIPLGVIRSFSGASSCVRGNRPQDWE